MSSQQSEYDAAPRSLGGEDTLTDGAFRQDWYVYWWRKDGRVHGSRGSGLSLASATRLAKEIREGEIVP